MKKYNVCRCSINLCIPAKDLAADPLNTVNATICPNAALKSLSASDRAPELLASRLDLDDALSVIGEVYSDHCVLANLKCDEAIRIRVRTVYVCPADDLNNAPVAISTFCPGVTYTRGGRDLRWDGDQWIDVTGIVDRTICHDVDMYELRKCISDAQYKSRFATGRKEDLQTFFRSCLFPLASYDASTCCDLLVNTFASKDEALEALAKYHACFEPRSLEADDSLRYYSYYVERVVCTVDDNGVILDRRSYDCRVDGPCVPLAFADYAPGTSITLSGVKYVYRDKTWINSAYLND